MNFYLARIFGHIRSTWGVRPTSASSPFQSPTRRWMVDLKKKKKWVTYALFFICFLTLIFLWLSLAWLNACSRTEAILSTLWAQSSISTCFSCSEFSKWSRTVNFGSHWFRWARVATIPAKKRQRQLYFETEFVKYFL